MARITEETIRRTLKALTEIYNKTHNDFSPINITAIFKSYDVPNCNWASVVLTSKNILLKAPVGSGIKYKWGDLWDVPSAKEAELFILWVRDYGAKAKHFSASVIKSVEAPRAPISLSKTVQEQPTDVMESSMTVNKTIPVKFMQEIAFKSSDGLNKYTVEELIGELQARGYTGIITQNLRF